MHWLVARSKIAQPLWSRARGHADELLRCAGCSGFWIGLALGFAGLRPVSLDGGAWAHLAEIGLTGLSSVFLVPVAEAALLWGLEHTAIERDVAVAPVLVPEAVMEKIADQVLADTTLSPAQTDRVLTVVRRELGLDS